MLSCCCQLAGTKACYSCLNYLKYFDPPIVKTGVYLKTKRIIEKYDKDGNLIERIIEE